MSQSTQNKLDDVQQAIANYKQFIENNSLNAEEVVNIKNSSISYEGPEGKFTIKCNPGKKQATADVRFVTGSFRSTVTEADVKTKGVDPVYHKHWGIFHAAFAEE